MMLTFVNYIKRENFAARRTYITAKVVLFVIMLKNVFNYVILI